MKKVYLFLIVLLISNYLFAQEDYIQVPENIITEGIPQLPASLIKEVNNYTEARGAYLVAWHPLKKEIIISTRLGNSSQLHYVKMPEGARKQITFFDEPVSSAFFEPVDGKYLILLKDNEGDEFTQIYRYDLLSKKTTLLTDGKRSKNERIVWNNKGDKIAYMSTKRNGRDKDIYIMDPLDPSTNRIVTENNGGGNWGVVDWSTDDSKLLVREGISVNEGRIYIVDINTGTKTRILPETDEHTKYEGICFSNDNNGIYIETSKDSEFKRLAYFDIATKKINYITNSIPWDLEDSYVSNDRSNLAFVTNENGLSKIYCLSTETNKFYQVPNLPVGIIMGVSWSGDSKSIGITIASYNSPADVYEYNTVTKKLTRWTESEIGNMDISTLKEPKLITWKSFDGKSISGYLYKASSKFTGKRPVIIAPHGGPEMQSKPFFLGSTNYYLSELGISIIYPNFRGSTGYGKSFVDLDNGMKREDPVKDIGALIDWIAQQPDLDEDRIMISGGSYGGYVSLAVSYLYSDKIRCSIDRYGVSNFNTLLKNTEAYRRDQRRAEYGDERNPEMATFFEATAPLNHTDKIKKPIFIVQGENDPRVPSSESIQMKNKIKENGGTVWFLYAKDEGHGFRKKDNVDFYFYSTIAFIKQFLLN